jgi:hypothetical protein
MVPKKPFNISSSPAPLQESFGGSLETSTFGSLPVTVWIKAFLRPHAELAIPKVDVHNFQVIAAVAMDQIWLVWNKNHS